MREREPLASSSEPLELKRRETRDTKSKSGKRHPDTTLTRTTQHSFTCYGTSYLPTYHHTLSPPYLTLPVLMKAGGFELLNLLQSRAFSSTNERELARRPASFEFCTEL